MNDSKQASFEFSLEWQSSSAKHKERHYFSKINYWRDVFPGTIGDRVDNLELDDSVTETLELGKVIEPYNKNKIYKIIKRKLGLEKLAEKRINLRKGRFYPRSALTAAGFASQDHRPIRVLDIDETYLVIDTNHPLYPHPIEVTGTLKKVLSKRCERGGNCNDIGLTLVDGGPGLQADLPDLNTQFFEDDPFVRKNETEDKDFYKTPRFMNHLDDKASELIAELYGQFIQPDMKVLDLMASCQSHLNIGPEKISLTGLGLNQQELDKNPLINNAIVHDLNNETKLPQVSGEMDAVICTASIEYLINPINVAKEIGRILKPGSPFIITFSDHWFEPKAIQVWSDLHPFERMGLVSNYLKQSGLFTDIHTESIRGYPRPARDRNIRIKRDSDPIFAVWGFKLDE